jgi:trigger factor
MKRFVLPLFSVLLLAACGDKEAGVGDTVAIHFEGFLDGVQFPGGTGDFDLKLGSGQFVPGFEDQLIGVKKGEVREVKLRFPDQYVPGLAGKEVMFKVTVNNIVSDNSDK